MCPQSVLAERNHRGARRFRWHSRATCSRRLPVASVAARASNSGHDFIQRQVAPSGGGREAASDASAERADKRSLWADTKVVFDGARKNPVKNAH